MKRIIGITSLLILMINSTMAQDDNKETNDEAMIREHWKTLSYVMPEKSVPELTIPLREFDSPMFCHELIRYQTGYIINSITSNPGPKVEVTTRYYYIDTVSWRLSRISYFNSDTIESILGAGKDSIVISFIKNGIRTINFIQNKTSVALLDSRARRFPLLDTAAWLKLGWHENIVYALTPNGVATYESNQWKLKTKLSVGRFFLDTLHYRRSFSILPTLNIQLTDDRLWFLQEIVQGRTSDLLYANIKTGVINELYRSIGYRDNYQRQVFSFVTGPQNQVVVAGSRLMEKFMVNDVKGDTNDVWIFGNQLNTPKGLLSRLFVSAIAKYNDTLYFAGYNGLFRKVGNEISPLIYWRKHKQTIHEKNLGDYEWEFAPRCIQRLTENEFLIGGLWGGLYLVDVKKSSITCLDDIEYDKVDRKQMQ